MKTSQNSTREQILNFNKDIHLRIPKEGERYVDTETNEIVQVYGVKKEEGHIILLASDGEKILPFQIFNQRIPYGQNDTYKFGKLITEDDLIV